jgi:mRNA interferase MazF
MPFEKEASLLMLTFGDILLVPFPFTDQTASKKRPAIVISTVAYNSARPDVIIMAVTSQLHASTAIGEIWLTEWEQAGLLKPSAIKPVIATLEQSLILKKLGHLTSVDMASLRIALDQII